MKDSYPVRVPYHIENQSRYALIVFLSISAFVRVGQTHPLSFLNAWRKDSTDPSIFPSASPPILGAHLKADPDSNMCDGQKCDCDLSKNDKENTTCNAPYPYQMCVPPKNPIKLTEKEKV